MQDSQLDILIVEDDSVDRQMLRRTLAKTELKVAIQEAESAGQALELLGGREFDIALIDYKLPDGTALSILKGMKERNSFLTPAIVLTAHAQKNLANDAMTEGAQDFLPKEEINSDNLERAIRYAIQRSKLIQELQESKERELREKELRFFQQSSAEFDTSKIPEVRKSAFTFDKFVNTYKNLLLQSLEETGYKVERGVPEKMKELAQELADLDASAKDVVDIHSTALSQAAKNAASARRGDSLNAEGRVLLVQLMGYLCMLYRDKLLRTR